MSGFSERLKEPSTYASISSLALMFGYFSGAEASAFSSIGDWLIPAIVGATGLVGVFKSEKVEDKKKVLFK